MTLARQDYESLVGGFNWAVPQAFNIGTDIADRWASSGRTALILDRADGGADRFSFADLTRLSNRLANGLSELGLGRGDRIGILLPQSLYTAIGHIAIYKLGAIAVPLAALFGPDAVRFRLADSGARALITDMAGLEKLAPIRAELGELRHILVSSGGAEGSVDIDTLIERASDRFTAAATGADDPAVMVYTSGTTGSPKGALHGHRVLHGHLPGVEFTHEFFPQTGDRIWTPSDWAWAGGLFNVLLPALHHGITVVGAAAGRFDPERALVLMARHEVRNLFLPATALRMMRAAGSSHDTVPNLRTIASGGESLGGAVYDWARQAFGLTINEFYGQTECNLVVGSCSAIGTGRRGSIGRPIPGHEVAVIDGEGQPAGPEETGEIAIRRPDPVMFLEYWNNAEATRDKFVGDWLKTGDQGYADGDGYLHFVGRDDDIITSAGYRIGPGEIEDCLVQHPAVSLAAAVGKPDPVRTEIVQAHIVLSAGHMPSAALTAEIQDHVRQRLSAHEYPREIVYVDELPLTTTGKVIRRLLRGRDG